MSLGILKKLGNIGVCQWRKRRGMLGLLIAAAVIVFCIKHTAFPLIIPQKIGWDTQSTHLWLNWSQPCRYYRFLSDDKRRNSIAWIRGNYTGLRPWNYAAVITDSRLHNGIRTITPERAKKKLSDALVRWSIPALGAEYASQTNSPFTLLLFKQPQPAGKYRYLHVKVTDTEQLGSLIEIWDLIMFSNPT